MLIIAGSITLDPDKRDVAMEAAVEMMTATREENGCIEYVFSIDPTDSAVVRLFEQWESDEALAAHFVAPHMAAFQAKMGDFGVTDMKIEKHQVSSSGPLR